MPIRKFQLSSKNEKFSKLDSIPILKRIYDEVSGDIKESDYLILHYWMCQQLEDLHKSVIQYFFQMVNVYQHEIYQWIFNPLTWFQTVPTFKKLPHVEFWCQIKKEYPQLSKKAIKILLSFPVIALCEAKFSSSTSTKTMDHIRLDAETDRKRQLFSIKPDIKETHKNVKQRHSSH